MAHYVHAGIFLISVPNLVVIGAMLVVFALAIWLRMPQERTPAEAERAPDARR